MIKISFIIEPNHKQKIKKETNLELLSDLTEWFSGTLVFECGNSSTKGYTIEPDILVVWLDWLIEDLKEIDNSYSDNIMGTNYTLTFLDNNLKILNKEKEEIFNCTIAKNDLIESLQIFAKEFVNYCVKINPLILKTEHKDFFKENSKK